MKQILLFIATLMGLNSFGITHSKPIDPIVFSINLPKEQTWQKVMDLFVANSIPIKLMDKSSGLIQSDKIGLGTHYALKNMDDSISWALCQAILNPEGAGLYFFPQTINTELQVYVREVDGGNVLLSVNLMNSKAESYNAETNFNREFDVQSSKRLETIIGNYIQSNEKMPTLAFDPPFATFGEPPSQIKKRQEAAQINRVEEEKREKSNGVAAVVLIIGVVAALLVFGTPKE